MEKYIYIANRKRAEEILGISFLEIQENLLARKERKIKDFLKKQKKYLYSYSIEGIKKFFSLIGITLEFYIHVDFFNDECYKNSPIKEILITENGVRIPKDHMDFNSFLCVHNHHLCVEVIGKTLEIKKDKIILDDVSLGNITILEKDRYEENYEKRLSFDKIKFDKDSIPRKKVLEKYNVRISSDELSYVTMDVFGHVISLTKKGELYLDNTLYSRGVEKIIDFNPNDLIFVYKNHVVEYYSSRQNLIHRSITCEKVLYGYHYLITLENQQVRMYFFVNMASACHLEPSSQTYELYFDEVDDIEIEETEEVYDLVLYKNKEKIRMPLYGICKLS